MNINSLSLQNKFILTYVTQDTDKIMWNIKKIKKNFSVKDLTLRLLCKVLIHF